MSIYEYSGWVRFSSPASYSEGFATACLPDDWGLDLTQDFSFTGDWYSAPPWPTYGEAGLALAVLPDVDIEAGMIEYGYSVAVGRYQYDDGDWYDYSHFNVCNVWSNNTPYQYYPPDYTYTATSGTMHVWYDASADQLFFGDFWQDPDAWVVDNFRSGSPSGSTIAYVGFGGYAGGDVPAINSNKLCGTNFCIDEGQLVGSAVGACCVGDSCIETIAFSCDGEWQGAGSDCEVCFAEPCQGDVDGDGEVDSDDLLQMIAAWATDDADCDLNGSGTVGVPDLLLLLEAWGPCE